MLCVLFALLAASLLASSTAPAASEPEPAALQRQWAIAGGRAVKMEWYGTPDDAFAAVGLKR